jgi:hypothetical protein
LPRLAASDGTIVELGCVLGGRLIAGEELPIVPRFRPSRRRGIRPEFLLIATPTVPVRP